MNIQDMEILVQLSDLRSQQHYEGRTLQLTVVVFKDSRLFPDRNNINKESSLVISANLGE